MAVGTADAPAAAAAEEMEVVTIAGGAVARGAVNDVVRERSRTFWKVLMQTTGR